MNVDLMKPVTAIALVDCVKGGRGRLMEDAFLGRKVKMLLRCEGQCDLPNATIEDVARALYEIARPDGPTYLVVEHGEESYAQAAGTEGRFVIESRTIFGEGFQHFRAFHDLSGPDSSTVVHFRQRCSKHPPRRCPLQVRESEVGGFADVEQVLLTFAATGERDGGLRWRDVTPEMVNDLNRRDDDDDGEIGLITPRVKIL
jgi:hypothetical protein